MGDITYDLTLRTYYTLLLEHNTVTPAYNGMASN
jgi:hypothetical protein